VTKPFRAERIVELAADITQRRAVAAKRAAFTIVAA